MIKVTGLSSQPLQKFKIPIDAGGVVACEIRYNPATQMWYIEFEYENFLVKNMRICSVLNLLEQYSNLIPFGFYVKTNFGTEPFLINDFQTGRVEIYILNSEEVQSIEDGYKNL